MSVTHTLLLKDIDKLMDVIRAESTKMKCAALCNLDFSLIEKFVDMIQTDIFFI